MVSIRNHRLYIVGHASDFTQKTEHLFIAAEKWTHVGFFSLTPEGKYDLLYTKEDPTMKLSFFSILFCATDKSTVKEILNGQNTRLGVEINDNT